MPKVIRQLISIAIAAILAAIAVYGTYQPMHKSQLFYHTLQDVGTVHSPPQFAALLSVPLDAPSPFGQRELVQATAGLVITLIRKPDTPPEVTAALVNFVNGRFLPILQQGRGIGFVPSLYTVGTSNVDAYLQTQNRIFLTAAENLFSRGLEASPNRPEFLYGLLDVYRLAENTEKVQAVADTILRLWPDDQGTRAALAGYLARP